MMDEAPGTYTQWVRQAIGLARARQGDMLSLFESSVPEPRELLREAMAATAVPELSRYYVSAFSGGNPFIREMLAAQYGVAQDHVICTTGATSGLALIYRACLAAGDRVLIETPSFDLFSDLAEVQGVTVDRFVRSGDRFAIDPDVVEAKLHPRTRLVVISNLHNPSGMAVDHAVMKQLADLAERRGFVLVVDEVYADYAREGVWPSPAQALSPAVISLSSLTKIYGLGALRCGWIVGAPETIAPIRRLSESTEFGVSTLSHAVAAQVMADRAVFDAHSRDYVARCRPVFDAWFARVSAAGLIGGLLPDDGCISFPSLPDVPDTRAFSHWLIERSGVLVAPGEYFGAPGRIRLGFCLEPERLTTGLAALEDGLRAYRDRASAA